MSTTVSPDALRRLLSQGDLDGFLDGLSPLLPGQPGDRTRLNVLSGLRVYFKWLLESGSPLLSPTPSSAAAYRSWLEAHYSPATIKNRLSQVRHLYDRLQELELVEHHPFRGIIGPLNSPEEHRLAYTPEEIARLAAHADVEERALILLGAHGGLTGPEVRALRFEDLRLEAGELEVRGRVIVGSEELLRALEAWGRTQGHTALFAARGPVFEVENDQLLRQRVFRLCQRANVSYKAWQALRNAAGLRMLGLTTRAAVRRHLGLEGKESLRPLVKLSGRARRWQRRGLTRDPTS